MKNFVIGIDVSKEKLDFSLLEGEKIVCEWICTNTTKAIAECLKKLKLPFEELLVCAEYTGQYAYPLSVVWKNLLLIYGSKIRLKSSIEAACSGEKTTALMQEK